MALTIEKHRMKVEKRYFVETFIEKLLLQNTTQLSFLNFNYLQRKLLKVFDKKKTYDEIVVQFLKNPSC